MRPPTLTRARRLYGAPVLHLLLICLGFAVVGYTVWLLGFTALWDPDRWWQSIAVWFVGAALAHDLVLFPVYAAADRILVAATRRRAARGSGRTGPRAVNFVRVPLLAVGLISLIFFPGIIRQGGGSYTRATGQTQEPFLHRWLVLCGLILLIGLLAYVVARARARRHPPTGREDPASDDPASDDPASDDPGPLTAAGSGAGDGPVTVPAVLLVAILTVVARRRRVRPR